MKRTAIIFIIVTFLLFLLEYWLRTRYQVQKDLSVYSISVNEELNRFHESLNRETQSGKFAKYFWQPGISEDELNTMKAVNRKVKSVTLIDKNYHILASSNGDFDMDALSGHFKKIKDKETSGLILLPKGIFGLYPVKDYSDRLAGYLLFEIRLAPFHPESVTFFATPSRNFLFVLDYEKLSLNDRKVLEKKVLDFSFAEDSYTRLKLRDEFLVSWKESAVEDIYLGLLFPAPSLSGFYSLYAFSMALLLFGFVLFRERTDLMTNSDVIRLILEKNRESLFSLRKNMDKIEEALKPGGLHVEKPVEGEVVGAREKVPSLPLHMRVMEEWEAGASPSDMEFILLDPMQEDWLIPAHREFDFREIEKSEEIRQKAFSNELLSLMDEIEKGKPEEEDFDAEIEKLNEKFTGRRLDEYGKILQRLYESDQPTEELEVALHYIKESMNADGLCLMLFDNYIGCYSYTMGAGIEEYWRHHFYILHEDPVIFVSTTETGDTKISAEKKSDPFFIKRFPPEEVESIAGLRTIPLHDFKINGILLAIYRKDHPGQPDGAWPKKAGKILDIHGDVYIHGIIPAIRRLYHSGEHFHAKYQYKELLRELRGVILQSSDPVTVLHVERRSMWTQEDLDEISREMSKITGYDERMIISSPGHIVFFLKYTAPDDIREVFGKMYEDNEYREYVYPEHGKSLFIYI